MKQVMRIFVEQRTLAVFTLSSAVGFALCVAAPFPENNSFLRYIALQRHTLYILLSWSYAILLFTTPFLFLSSVASLAYMHLRRTGDREAKGQLPPYPPEAQRDDLFVILGEVHHQTRPIPVAHPNWLVIPERGLYTGIAVFGSIGSGKTQALILPAMRQLFSYKADDQAEKLSGLVLEVKGDLCRQLARILAACGRTRDYIEISLTSRWRYNPLHNDLDAYALAYNIASLLTNIWGRGKEPFWQQSYTDLVKYIIILHKVKDGYVTLFDIYATAISPSRFEELLIDTGTKLSNASWIGISGKQFVKSRIEETRFGFEWDSNIGEYRARHTQELECFIVDETDIEAVVYEPHAVDATKRELFEAVDRWYWEHWKHLRPDIKTSVVQGIAVFLSLFDTDPQVKRIFCPPKELYEDRACTSDPDGTVLPPFNELIEEGKVCALNFPVALNPGLAKAIGTMMKQDFQRAVLLRIPKMETAPNQHFRPTVFLCDEYQNFATVGASDPNGDERFLSLARQPKCIPVIATQSINSIREALPGSGYKTLLQSFRTKIFLATSDPDTAKYASELCGKTEKVRMNYNISENSNDAHIGFLSGKATANKVTVSTSKSYQKHKDVIFEDKMFYQLKNAQAIAVAYDGINPLPPTYCFLKPEFLPRDMTWFEQQAIGFDPQRFA